MAVPRDIRLLVADGDSEIRKTLGRDMRQVGLANVVFAAELQSTATALKNGHFDLLVVDWNIASFKDFLLVRKIRTSSRLSEIPILVMAGQDSQENRRQAKSAGVGGFIAKPFSTKALFVEMEASLKGRKRPVAPVAQTSAATVPVGSGPAAPAVPTAPAQPIDPRAKKLFQEGYVKLKAQRFEEALKDFEQAFKIDDLFADAYKGAAFASKGQGDMEGSKHFMGKAAESYVVHNRHEDAATIYGNLRKVDPNAPNPFKNAGKRLRAEGRLDRAAAALEKGFEFSPTDDELAAELAFTYKDQGADDKAEDFLRELLGGDGEFPLAAETFLSLTGQDFYAIGGEGGEAPKIQFLEDKKTAKKTGSDLRTAKRLAMADYSARELKTKLLLSVIDISVTGIGFKPMAGKFKDGEVVRFDLIAMGNVKAKKMAAKVMRVTPNVVGCRFVEVSGKQKKVLETLFGKD